MKQLFVITCIGVFLIACGNQNGDGKPQAGTENKDAVKKAGENPAYDPQRGIGKFTKVDVGTTLDAGMAASGDKIYGVKCSSCHKLTDEKLVGPGWKDVTKRHSAEWIMNFATNPDEMLDKDPKAQAMYEICLVRMPNQNLTDDEARQLYEFMRKNDGVK
ncbi:c-type cytochrome [Chitinophagaceae bacterium LWZ2-11]